jgi:hypothetical protein
LPLSSNLTTPLLRTSGSVESVIARAILCGCGGLLPASRARHQRRILSRPVCTRGRVVHREPGATCHRIVKLRPGNDRTPEHRLVPGVAVDVGDDRTAAWAESCMQRSLRCPRGAAVGGALTLAGRPRFRLPAWRQA